MTKSKPGNAGFVEAASRRGTPSPESAALTASVYLPEERDSRFSRAIIWTTVVAFGAFLAWAAGTPVYELVTGQGTIRPEGLSKRVEHLEGGIVGEIFVAEGDPVRAGETLVTLEDTALRAEMRKVRVTVDRLAERIAHHTALLDVDLSGGAAALPADVLADVDQLFAEDVKYRLAQIDVLTSEAEVTRGRLDALIDKRARLAEELAILETQQERYTPAAEARVVPLRQLEGLQREIIQLRSAIRETEGEETVLRATLSRTAAQKAELIGGFRREAAERLATGREELAAARESLAQIEYRLERSTLRAPVSGVVQGLAVQGPGEVLAAGEVLMEIVPEGTHAFAEVEVPASRIGGVEIGQEASIKILAHDFTRFGDVSGKVERVSPSSFRRERGEQVFRVQLSFDTTVLSPLDGSQVAPRSISPGMTVVADIKSDRRSILSYLLKPIRASSHRALTEA